MQLDETTTKEDAPKDTYITQDNEENMGGGPVNTPSLPPESSINTEIPVSLDNAQSPVNKQETAIIKPASDQNLNKARSEIKSLIREFLNNAKVAIQFRKRKKLDRIMTMFDKKKNGSTSSPQVTNNEVQKFLHLSEATATRYLDILEKENKIKQGEKIGKAVTYVSAR